MSNNYLEKPHYKYTRGEYCLSFHTFATIGLILILVAIYTIHLYIIKHSTRTAFKIIPLSPEYIIQSESAEYAPVGVLYLSLNPPEFVCNGVLLRRRWTVAPAHVVGMYNAPDMAAIKLSWRLAYANNYSGYDETRIRRAISHPDFRVTDLSYNIGLFEHTIVVLDETFEYVFPQYIPMSDSVLQEYSQMMYIITTDGIYEEEGDWYNTMIKHLVSPFNSTECKEIVNPIITLRSYEFCVTFTKTKAALINHGSAFMINSKISGFFTWGDKSSSGIPFVILHIDFFQHWLNNTINSQEPFNASTGIQNKSLNTQ